MQFKFFTRGRIQHTSDYCTTLIAKKQCGKDSLQDFKTIKPVLQNTQKSKKTTGGGNNNITF